MNEHLSHSTDETMQIAAELGRQLKGGELLALHGDLGAGKTCFVRGLARGLGIEPSVVSSPTFVIMHEYESSRQSSPRVLVHVDAYRLGGAADLDAIGWEEVIGRSDHVVAVEWAERVADALPGDRLDVTLEHRGGEDRLIRIEPRGNVTLPSTVAAASGGATRPCPVCEMQVAIEAETFPFCSKRCRMADLNRWLGGGYRVSRPATDPRDWEEQPE